ncbi:MAG TPA: GHKL domain-containing protein [Clostridiaceae bacterium]
MMIFYLFFRLAFLTIFMASLTQLKYSNKKSCIMIVVFIFALWLANLPIILYKGSNFLDYVYPLTVAIPAFMFFLFLSKAKGPKVLFSFLTVCNFGMIISNIGILFLIIFNDFAIRVFVEFICFALIMFLILKAFQKPYFKLLDSLDKGWGLLCGVPSLLAVIFYILLYYTSPFYKPPVVIFMTFLIFALMFVFYAIVYFNFENISQFYQLKQDREVMLIQTDMEKKEYNAIMDKINANQIYRHDMKHHIDILSTLLQDKNIMEAQKYLSKLSDNLNEIVVEKYCENYRINVILSSYISKARKENINVKSKVHISENIKIDNMELGLVFANALENAINACKKNENEKSRTITIICKEHYDHIYLQISNTFVEEVQFQGEYPVSNNKDHGIGTRSIGAIAEKYNGVFSFKAQDGIFKATVILKEINVVKE